MSDDLNYEGMLFDITKVMAKYMNAMKKNDNILNQLPLVKNLREQIAHYEKNYENEIKNLRKKVEKLEKTQRTQSYLCRTRSRKVYNILKEPQNISWAPKCKNRKSFDGDVLVHNCLSKSSLTSYEEAKKFASTMSEE